MRHADLDLDARRPDQYTDLDEHAHRHARLSHEHAYGYRDGYRDGFRLLYYYFHRTARDHCYFCIHLYSQLYFHAGSYL